MARCAEPACFLRARGCPNREAPSHPARAGICPQGCAFSLSGERIAPFASLFCVRRCPRVFLVGNARVRRSLAWMLPSDTRCDVSVPAIMRFYPCADAPVPTVLSTRRRRIPVSRDAPCGKPIVARMIVAIPHVWMHRPRGVHGVARPRFCPRHASVLRARVCQTSHSTAPRMGLLRARGCTLLHVHALQGRSVSSARGCTRGIDDVVASGSSSACA